MTQAGATLSQQAAQSGHSISSPPPRMTAMPPLLAGPATLSSSNVDGRDCAFDLSPPDSESDACPVPADDGIDVQPQLIARGRVLLQIYQNQRWLQKKSKCTPRAVPQDDYKTVYNSQPLLDSNQKNRDFNCISPERHIVAVEAPPMKTNKVEEVLPSPLFVDSPPPRRTTIGPIGDFKINPSPSFKFIGNQLPLSRNKNEKSWTDFMQLLTNNGQMMDLVDAQLAEIWAELAAAEDEASEGHILVDKWSQIVTQLLRQKREAGKALSKLVEVLGSRAFLAGKLTDDAVQFVSNQLRLELETSRGLTEKVKQERAVCKKEDLHASKSERANGKEPLWQQQLQGRGQQLQASQAAVATLEEQLMQQKKKAADEKKQLQQALEVKLREVNALCGDVILPVDYEQIKTAEGVLCYHRKGSDGSNVLEDPRVPIAIKLRSGPALARAVDQEPSLTSDNIVSAVDVHSHLACDHAADGDETRRSFSTPHVMQCSDVLENIHVPLDGSHKHSIEDLTPPLPSGWEMRVTLSGAIFFYNKFTSTTTWTDPRLLGAAHAPSSPSDHARQEQALVCNSSVITFESQPSRPDSIAIHAESIHDAFHCIDVVFEDRGPIGVHFQANVPDLGATVMSLAPDMADSVKGVIAPDDELIAVNKNAVESAPFRHVMLLLQEISRPLTLTFKRARKEAQRPIDPGAASPSSDGGVSIIGTGYASDTLLDDECVIDEGTVVDLEQLRVPTVSPNPTAGHRDDSEASMNVADVIITNIFSLFWKPGSSSVD